MSHGMQKKLKGRSPTRSGHSQNEGLYPRIWDIVEKVPRGKVATYGQIARLAGLERNARMTGYALNALPPGIPVPWHRIINARGMISFPNGSASAATQRRLLEEEGILFMKGRVNFERYGWRKEKRGSKRRGNRAGE